MTKVILLGIIGLSMFAIAPFVGASSSITTTESSNPLSRLLARTIFDVAEETRDTEFDERRENRTERREEGRIDERREDAERFFD